MVEVIVGYPGPSASGWNMHLISSFSDPQAGQMMQLRCKNRKIGKTCPQKLALSRNEIAWMDQRMKSILKPTSTSIF